MNKLIYPIRIASINTNFFAFHEAVKAWDIDFIQLGSGSFQADLKQLIYPEIQFARVHFNSNVKQEGTSPEGFWSFAFVNDKRLHWRNYLIKPQSIIIYSPKSTINAISLPGFEVRIVSISELKIKEFCKKANISFLSKIQNLLIVQPSQKGWGTTVNWVDEILLNPPNQVPFESIERLISVVQKSTEYCIEVSKTPRLELLKKAEWYIKNHISQTVTVKEIAVECDVSERTLLYAFKQRFGIGPKAFVSILKLNAVYRDLNKNESGLSISKIAKKYGFWHMGQFHQDYKAFFGELPSETRK